MKADLPNEDSQNQNIPEQVKELEQKDRYKYLIFHPPYHPYTVLWNPHFRSYTMKSNQHLVTGLQIRSNSRHEIKLGPNGVQHYKIEPVSEIAEDRIFN